MATLALNRELPDSTTFENVRDKSKSVWHSLMSRFEIPEETDNTHALTFSRCLYRSLLFPRNLSEIDDSGNLIHYSPYDAHGRTYEDILNY